MSTPPKGTADYYEPGDWNAVCYECGRKRKASQLKKHWQGYFVCPEHWEARHPQDFVRGVQDIQTPPWTQPEPADHFLFGDSIVTESSDMFHGDFDYILTEDNQRIYQEN